MLRRLISPRLLLLPLLATIFFSAELLPCSAQSAAADSDSTAIVQLLQHSAQDWNRGDLDAFATSYKNSPDILFIGSTIHHGYADMLAGYKKAYSTPALMGQISFTDLAVQPLDSHFATATGWFHLQRSAADGGNANGYFLLVLEKTSDGWKIIRDDTTSVPLAR